MSLAACLAVSSPTLIRAQAISEQLPSTQMVAPKAMCEALQTMNFGGIVDAPTSILSATAVADSGDTPAYCDVKGVISPQDQFELRLPDSWNQRYFQSGCGGWCGIVVPSADCNRALSQSFATALDDQGHVGAGTGDGVFALNDMQLRREFGSLAEHRLALASKAMLVAYYGVGPRYSYFDGCSDGGMEALSEAQRYPQDFDGIIAGAPAIIRAPLDGEYQSWLTRINLDASGNHILTPDKLPALHDAVVAACDRLDGLVDGQIDDPRECQFDPTRLTCAAGRDAADCLTPAQVQVVKKAYSGPATDDGVRLYPGGEQPGSELAWAPWFVAEGGAPTISAGIGTALLRYAAFDVGNLGPSIQDWTFTLHDFDRLRPAGQIYNATNPDLRPFRDRGGKVLLYHGWADQAISPIGTIEYYQAIQDHMGGLETTQQFARLFMLPSMYHCAGGFGPNQFDAIAPIVAWVEEGQAPDTLI
ncbi:MAG: tannase/feruloyl esterase family alpha/beta hydrolase, partial [Chloroflexi bacterium]|nr:tannase/feruloyl esterase family alpha/beta hydrolase [Chloroflexota bacterium]